MRKRASIITSLCLAILIVLICPASSMAANYLWSTTYNCNDWTQSDGLTSGSVNCDGLSGDGGWTCAGNEEQITVAANYPGGNGGKGQRHWEGDGINVNSGGMSITFPSQQELWIRWYMRYQAGFQWSPLIYDKILYIHTNVGGRDAIPEFVGSNGWQIYAQNGSGGNPCSNCGWNAIMGGTVSDGKWHAYEIHIKMDTNGSNGIAEFWSDGTKKLSLSNIDYGTVAGWNSFLIGSNQRAPINGSCMYVDFDDFAISNSGYIGPFNTPASPTNLQAN